jgi:hypothetical protein
MYGWLLPQRLLRLQNQRKRLKRSEAAIFGVGVGFLGPIKIDRAAAGTRNSK